MTDPAFVLGAALTASELEGVADTADWARWIGSGRAPSSGDGAGFRTSWQDDLALLASLGMTEIMVTLEWARLWPTAASPDGGEVEFRRDLLTHAIELGMQPWGCLVDGSLPGWFADDERGFGDDRSRNLLWPRHVDWVGETFGDLIAGWVPLREPLQWAMWGNVVGATPPGLQRRRDGLKAAASMRSADLIAERLLRGSAPVATFVTGRAVLAERDNVKATPHARWLEEQLSSVWLHELAEGEGRDAFDRVIAQLRPPIVVDGDGEWKALGPRPDATSMLDGLEPVIAASGDRSIVAAGDLAGVADDGDAQVDHLRTLIDGVLELGGDGWWQTSPIDGWHWQHGFTRTPGLVDRDRTQRPATTALPTTALPPDSSTTALPPDSPSTALPLDS